MVDAVQFSLEVANYLVPLPAALVFRGRTPHLGVTSTSQRVGTPMKIELRKTSDIKPYPGNPRLNDSAVDVVARFNGSQPAPIPQAGLTAFTNSYSNR